MQRPLKRLLDLTLASVALTTSAPLLLAAALAVWLEDGGPVLFAQQRLGLDGRPFRLWKLRTMRVDAEQMLARWRAQNSPQWQAYVANNFKLPADPRITRVGRFLRRTSLDELPQLWNVLRGDMSLVGPRPLLPSEADDYGADALREYVKVRPGLTGLWQISGRSDTRFADRVRLDLHYLRTWSLALDLRVLVRTVRVVLLGHGAR